MNNDNGTREIVTALGACAAERFRRQKVGIRRQIYGDGARFRHPNP